MSKERSGNGRDYMVTVNGVRMPWSEYLAQMDKEVTDARRGGVVESHPQMRELYIGGEKNEGGVIALADQCVACQGTGVSSVGYSCPICGGSGYDTRPEVGRQQRAEGAAVDLFNDWQRGLYTEGGGATKGMRQGATVYRGSQPWGYAGGTTWHKKPAMKLTDEVIAEFKVKDFAFIVKPDMRLWRRTAGAVQAEVPLFSFDARKLVLGETAADSEIQPKLLGYDVSLIPPAAALTYWRNVLKAEVPGEAYLMVGRDMATQEWVAMIPKQDASGGDVKTPDTEPMTLKGLELGIERLPGDAHLHPGNMTGRSGTDTKDWEVSNGIHMILPREGGEWALYVSVSGHVFDVSEKLPYEEDGKVYRMVGEDGRTENFKELIVPERKQFVMHGGGQSGLYSGGGVRYMREDGYEWDWKRGVWTKPEKVEKAAATGAGKGGEDAGSLHSRCAKLRNELWKGCTQLAKKVQNTMPKGQAYVMLESVLSGLGGTGVPEGMLKAAIKHVFDEAPQVDEMWIVEVSGKTRLVPKELAMLLRQVYGEGLEIMPIFEEEEVSDGFVGE